jgi:hypothetical protein
MMSVHVGAFLADAHFDDRKPGVHKERPYVSHA